MYYHIGMGITNYERSANLTREQREKKQSPKEACLNTSMYILQHSNWVLPPLFKNLSKKEKAEPPSKV